jgi:RNA polymerase sigma-70 factor, ECF subfamily
VIVTTRSGDRGAYDEAVDAEGPDVHDTMRFASSVVAPYIEGMGKRLARSITRSPGAPPLSRRIREGDARALDELLQREWAGLVTYAARFVDDIDSAEDLAQRAFVRLWRGRREVEDGRSLRGLLYRTTRNLAIDVRRTRRTRRRIREHLFGTRRPDRPDERLRQRELRGAIEAAIDELSPRRQEAFRLCRLHGLTQREAAEAMGVSPQTVANHVTAALRHVRDALAPHLS